MATIFVLKDESSTSGAVVEMLEKLRHKLIEITSASQALSLLKSGNTDVIVIDHQLRTDSIVKKLIAIKNDPALSLVPVIVISAETNSDETIEVMRLGAFDHLSMPVNFNELKALIDRAIAVPKRADSAGVEKHGISNFLIGQSPAMHNVQKLIGIAAACDATVLVVGESGTGKDTIARAIHAYSRHQNEPLTVIDCTAVPDDYGSFQSLLPGGLGTVILDEIGDLNIQMQAKLVRALKEASIEITNGPPAAIRIIATTQHNLIDMVKEKRLREDLYYRLHVLPIVLPPLRERSTDILALAKAFLLQAKPDVPKQLSSGAVKVLLDYQWPGNVRELQNLMYHLSVVVRATIIDESDLAIIKESINPEKKNELPLDYYKAMDTIEKNLLERALQEANGSRVKAARLLGINRQLLYTKLKTHKLIT
jgi:DNA-binding NtrC family response regulator